jgi:sugar-phosphatase
MTALGLPGAVLLDLDGTLVDTAALHARAFACALSEGAPALLPAFRYEAVAGLTTREALLRIGVPDERVATLTRAKQAAYRALVTEAPAPAFDGAAALLRFLDDRRVPWVVVTSGSRASVLATLAASGLSAPRLVCADDVQRGKPAADPYLAGAERAGVAVARCLAVEDAVVGIASARAAGAQVVSVQGPAPMKDVPHFATLEALRLALAAAGEAS